MGNHKSKQRAAAACGGATGSPRDGPGRPRLARRPRGSWPPRGPAPPFPPRPPPLPREPSPRAILRFRPAPGEQGLCITQGDSPSQNRPRAVLWCLRPALQPAARIHLRAQCWLPSPFGPPPIDRPWCILIITVHFTVIHVQEVSHSSYLCDGSNLLRLISSQFDLCWWQVGC